MEPQQVQIHNSRNEVNLGKAASGRPQSCNNDVFLILPFLVALCKFSITFIKAPNIFQR